MSLISNGVRTNCNPMLQLGAPLAGSQTLSGRKNPGSLLNFHTGEATVVLQQATFTVDTGTDLITTSLNILDALEVTFTTTGTLPAPLTVNTTYWLIRVSASTYKIATSQANALAGTQVDITDAGSGTHTLAVYMSQSNKAGRPSGSEPPNTWVIPIRGGGLSAFTSLNADHLLTANVVPTKSQLVTLAQVTLILNAPVSYSKTLTLDATLVSEGQVSAVLQAIANMTATLVNPNSLNPPLNLTAYIEAVLANPNAISADFTGIARLEAELTSTGETLSTANVGQAVWAYLIESGYSAEEIMRLLAAVQLGESSGFNGGPTTGTFRDINDTKDRVIADVDSSGNRTNITLDPN